jgi:hypothetical protein
MFLLRTRKQKRHCTRPARKRFVYPFCYLILNCIYFFINLIFQNIETVKLLLAYGADLLAENVSLFVFTFFFSFFFLFFLIHKKHNGQIPLEYAREYSERVKANPEMIDFLTEKINTIQN